MAQATAMEMTGSDRRQLERLIQVKKLREGEALRQYIPHAGQRAFHWSPAKIRLARTGNRFGKTSMGLAEDAWWLLGNHPYREVPSPCRLLIMAKDKDTLGILCRRLLVDSELKRQDGEPIRTPLIPPRLVEAISYDDKRQSIVKYVKFKNGSELICRTAEQGREKLQSDNWHAVHMDEQFENGDQLYGEIMRGLIDYSGSLWITATPLGRSEYLLNISDNSGKIWDFRTNAEGDIKTMDGGNPTIHEFLADTYGNPYLLKSEIDRLFDNLTEDERAARIRGEFLDLGGLIYPGHIFTEENIVEPENVPTAGTRYISIDPGFHHHAAVLWGIVDDKNTLYLYRELYQRHLDYQTLARRIVDLSEGEPITAISIDPAAKATRSETRGKSMRQLLAEEFYKHGFKAEHTGYLPVAASNQVEAGLHQVKLWMMSRDDMDTGEHHSPRLMICAADMPNFMKEIKRYRKKPDPKFASQEKVLKRSDHLMDAMRYLIAGSPVYIPPKGAVAMTAEEQVIFDNSQGVYDDFQRDKALAKQRQTMRKQQYFRGVMNG